MISSASGLHLQLRSQSPLCVLHVKKVAIAGRKSKSKEITWLKKKLMMLMAGAPALQSARTFSIERHTRGLMGNRT